MNTQSLIALGLVLAAVVYCGHDNVCKDNLLTIATLGGTIIGIVGGLAKQAQDRMRGRRPGKLTESGNHGRADSLPPDQRKPSVL